MVMNDKIHLHDSVADMCDDFEIFEIESKNFKQKINSVNYWKTWYDRGNIHENQSNKEKNTSIKMENPDFFISESNLFLMLLKMDIRCYENYRPFKRRSIMPTEEICVYVGLEIAM